MRITNHSSRFIEMFGGIQNGRKWPLKKLSEICHLVNGYAFKSSLYSNEGYSVIRIANVQKGCIDDSDRAYYPVSFEREFKDSILQKGDILISLTGNVGRVGVITDEHLPAALNQRVQGLRLRKGIPMSNDFLFCVLNLDEFESLCIENASGSAQLNLSTIWVRDFQIICPPFYKQREFTQFANQADKSKFNGFKSRFIEMFGQISDTTPRYEVKKLSDCCPYISDGSHFSPTEDSSGPYPMLSVKDMTENGFVYSDCKYISKKDFDVLVSNGCQPHLNDVLVAKDGSYFKYSFVVTEDKEQAILSSIAIIRPKTDVLDPRYLAYYMLTDAVIQLVEKNYLTGTAIRRVILKGFKEIPTIIPPMELQKSFVSVLGQADKSKYLS